MSSTWRHSLGNITADQNATDAIIDVNPLDWSVDLEHPKKYYYVLPAMQYTGGYD